MADTEACLGGRRDTRADTVCDGLGGGGVVERRGGEEREGRGRRGGEGGEVREGR